MSGVRSPGVVTVVGGVARMGHERSFWGTRAMILKVWSGGPLRPFRRLCEMRAIFILITNAICLFLLS